MPSYLIDRCPNCPNDYYPIMGDGPTPCDVMGIGERPGKKEQERGCVFVGPTGQETNDTYFPIAGLYRPDVRMTNAVKCWADNNRTPTPAEVESCANHFLPGELKRAKPELVILLGAQACRIADNPPRLEMHHGRPIWGSLLNGAWEGWYWPMYHPAAGLREGAKMTALLDDFRNMREWLEGNWLPPTAPDHVAVDYAYCDKSDDLLDYLDTYNAVIDMACDTENHGKDKFSIQISHTPHTGRMILATNQQVVKTFRDWAGMSSATWQFHFAAHDQDELAKYQIAQFYGIDNWRDTMQEAYHLTNLPQGLKPLAYRLLGVTMRSWEDVVWPASIEAFTDWAGGALTLAGIDDSLQSKTEILLNSFRCADCGRRHMRRPVAIQKTKKHAAVPAGRCKSCQGELQAAVKVEWKIGAAAAVLKHILRYVTAKDQDLDTPYHPWKKIEEMKIDGLRSRIPEKWEWDAIEETMGPMPLLGIGNVEPTEALVYGCSDADHTGQVASELVGIRAREMGKGGGLVVDREDWDQ